MAKPTINADMGEYAHDDVDFSDLLAKDKALLQIIDLANIAVGGHAGDYHSLKTLLPIAKHHQVKIGAHPSFPDKENFGRQDMDISWPEMEISLDEQLSLFFDICDQIDIKPYHMKPHGALYNRLAKDDEWAFLMAKYLQKQGRGLGILTLAGGSFYKIGVKSGLNMIAEGFADRGYDQDGFLIPRGQEGAYITTNEDLKTQIKYFQSSDFPHEIETICVHGDNPHALKMAQLTKSFLE